jgi:hypothetical protein
MNGNIKSHAEAQAAAMMCIRRWSGATLYINRVPCTGPNGCGMMLPPMLPEGATLRVVGPEGYDVPFTGLPDE